MGTRKMGTRRRSRQYRQRGGDAYLNSLAKNTVMSSVSPRAVANTKAAANAAARERLLKLTYTPRGPI